MKIKMILKICFGIMKIMRILKSLCSKFLNYCLGLSFCLVIKAYEQEKDTQTPTD